MVSVTWFPCGQNLNLSIKLNVLIFYSYTKIIVFYSTINEINNMLLQRGLLQK